MNESIQNVLNKVFGFPNIQSRVITNYFFFKKQLGVFLDQLIFWTATYYVYLSTNMQKWSYSYLIALLIKSTIPSSGKLNNNHWVALRLYLKICTFL